MAKKSNNRGGHNSKQSKAMKYQIRADIKVNGTVQRKDIIGAIMGQTEGLLGDELELRKLQKTARIGHVDVEMETKGGKVHGMIIIPSSLDNVETATGVSLSFARDKPPKTVTPDRTFSPGLS